MQWGPREGSALLSSLRPGWRGVLLPLRLRDPSPFCEEQQPFLEWRSLGSVGHVSLASLWRNNGLDVRKKTCSDTVQSFSPQGSLLCAAPFGQGRSAGHLLGGQWPSTPSRSIEGAATPSLKSNSQLCVAVLLMVIAQIKGSQTSWCGG